MNFSRKVAVFFAVLARFLFEAGSRALSQVIAELKPKEKIALTEQLYFRIKSPSLTLMSVGAGEIQAMELSVSQAQEIFQSIKRACDLQEIAEIKIGDLSWKTDARLQSNPDRVLIKFNGPLGSTRTDARRKDVAAAIVEFASRFGLK